MKTVIRCLLAALIFLFIVPVRADGCEHEFELRREVPTCDMGGMSWLACIHCGFSMDYQALDPLGHTFDKWYVLTDPTCNQDGIQARDCLVCGFRETAPLPHRGHDFVAEVRLPTCTAGGYTRNTCKNCTAYFISDQTQALGHRYDEGVVIKEPTLTAMGRILYTCIGCNDTYQVTIPTLHNPFVDVDKHAYYFDPVLWAVYWGITSGLDETHFGPDRLCNRAQVVTFLWRAAGKPEPQTLSNPFRDVPKGCFYEKAVLWAYESNITTGTDTGIFSPETPCNRAQVVTFLHRARGCPEPTVNSAFPDVPAGSFYHKAVLWAAERAITVGMDGGNFCPALACTRGQIVTFLHRDAKNP